MDQPTASATVEVTGHITAVNLASTNQPAPNVVGSNPAYDFFFTETYQQLPKLRLAPDLLVYINNSRTFRTWLGDTFDFNDWLVSASGAAGMDRQNSCNLTFYIPRHLEHYFVGLGGRFILRPFQEVEIYAKGRFLVDASADDYATEAELYGSQLDTSDPNPPISRFYRIFWGWVQSITSEWQEGDYQIIVQCSMALRIMELTHIRNNLVALGSVDRQNGITPFDNPGSQGNPIQVILDIFSKDVSGVTEFNPTNIALASEADKAIYTAGNMGMSQSYKMNAARSLLVWNQRIKELIKRTTIFGLGYSDPSQGKTNDTSSNMTAAAEVASEFTRRTVAQASGESKTTLLSLKKREKAVLEQTIQDDTEALAKAKAAYTSNLDTFTAKRRGDFKFLLDIIKMDPTVHIMNPPASSVLWEFGRSVQELRTTSDIDNLDQHPAWVQQIDAFIALQLKDYSNAVDKLTLSIGYNTSQVANLSNEISLLESEVATYTSSQKSEGQSLTKRMVVGPLTLADILNASESSQRTDPRQSEAGGAKSRNNQDPKTGTWNLYIQDWAAANYCPFFKLGDFKLFNFDENTTRLEILTRMADVIGYEFYQDLSGNIIFKPPFYNMDTRDDAVFNINDIDIMSEQFSEDEGQIKLTSAVVLGSQHPMTEDGTPQEIRPQSQHIDLALVAKYGQRTKSISMPMVRTGEQAHVYAVSSIAKENRFAKRINVQIPARPELMLGFPVYLQGRDCFGYLERINWSYSAGNDFTFQLELTAIRRRIYINRKRLNELMTGRSGGKIKNLPTEVKKVETGSSTPAKSPAPAQTQDQSAQKPSVTESSRCFPLKGSNFKITSPFWELRPATAKKKAYPHQGVDIRVEEGTPLYAPCDATLYTATPPLSTPEGKRKMTGSGMSLVLETTDGYYLHFHHLLSIQAPANCVIPKGTLIGTTGGWTRTKALLKDAGLSEASINSTGPHLHWGVRKPGLGNKTDDWVDPYFWVDGKSTCTSTSATRPTCDEPKEVKPSFLYEAPADTNRVSTRKSNGTNLADMVPLPYGAIQLFRDPAKEKGVPQTDFIKSGNLLSKIEETTSSKIDAAKKAAAGLETAQKIYAGVDKKLSEALVLPSQQLSDLNRDASLAAYDTSATSVPDPAANLVSRYTSKNTEAYIKFLGLKTKYASAKLSYDRDDSQANKANLDVVSNAYLLSYLAASKECLAQVETERDAAGKVVKELNISRESSLKTIQQNLVEPHSRELIASTQVAQESLKDRVAIHTGKAQEYTETEVDDILDADPDCQIFAFGQDTFKDPKAQFTLTDETKKNNAMVQRKLNATAYLRPNIYHPYRIVVDPVFMGPLKTAQPELAPDNAEAVSKAKIAWQNGSIPATTPDVTVATAAAQQSASSLAEASASLANLEGVRKNELSKKASLDANLKALNSSLVLKSDVESFAYVLTMYDNGNGTTNISKLRAKLPMPLFDQLVSKPEYTLTNEPYALSVVFGEEPSLDDFISFVSKGYTLLKTTYDAQQTSLSNLLAASKRSSERLTELDTLIQQAQAVKDRLQGVQSASNRRLNALSRGSAGNTIIGSDAIDSIAYQRLLTTQQPYTDANGFEQISGFPWGRSVSVTSAVDTLRLDATAKRFTDMTPQVTLKKSRSLMTKSASELPQPVSRTGSDAVALLANLTVKAAQTSEALGQTLPAGLALQKITAPMVNPEDPPASSEDDIN